MQTELSPPSATAGGTRVRLTRSPDAAAVSEWLGDTGGGAGAFAPDRSRGGDRDFVCYVGEASPAECLLAGRKLGGRLAKTSLETVTLRSEDLETAQWSNVLRGLWLATYRLARWREGEPAEPLASLTVYVDDGRADITVAHLEEVRRVAVGQMAAMHLVDRPANAKRPSDVADYVALLGEAHGFEVEVLDEVQLEVQGFGGILAVGRGSAHPPRLLKLSYGTAGPHVGLVGKGVTFDTGGISIKASQNMGAMKSDLGGAAAVLGTFVSAAAQALPARLSGLLPLAENMPGGNAYLPSDVIRNYGGKTIEITDTDAEGRLLLADALAYLPEWRTPDFTVDLATLTGSAVRTFGYECAALFTHDDAFVRDLSASGEAVGELVWPLPLFEAYERDLHSDVADVKHFHGKPISGAINAAKFLEYFVADKARWAHLDIAGVAFGHNDFSRDRSASGYGVALLSRYLKQLTDG